jgi:hypothetical protein
MTSRPNRLAMSAVRKRIQLCNSERGFCGFSPLAIRRSVSVRVSTVRRRTLGCTFCTIR